MIVLSLLNANIRLNDAIAYPGDAGNMDVYQLQSFGSCDLAEIAICRDHNALKDAVSDHHKGRSSPLQRMMKSKRQTSAIVEVACRIVSPPIAAIDATILLDIS